MEGRHRESERVRGLFLFLDAISKNTQSQGLRGSNGFLLRCAVSKDSGEIQDFGDPSAVVFALRFDFVFFPRHWDLSNSLP